MVLLRMVSPIHKRTYNQILNWRLLLKETNDTDGGGWDLRQFLREGGRSQSWNMVSCWIHGIRNMRHISNWDYYTKIDTQFRIDMLQSICAINLKKSPGGHTADAKELEKIANEDRKNSKKQYALYDPDLTICCGTGDLFKSVVEHDNKWQTTRRGIYWYKRADNKFVIALSSSRSPIAGTQFCFIVCWIAVREIYAIEA